MTLGRHQSLGWSAMPSPCQDSDRLEACPTQSLQQITSNASMRALSQISEQLAGTTPQVITPMRATGAQQVDLLRPSRNRAKQLAKVAHQLTP